MWAYETTFYQIYPLGFCGAPRENAAPVAEDELAQAANAAPNPDAPIMKIAQWADYLQELGIGAVLINPPLESDSHGYDTRSLRHIDRRLGGDADFAAVCETLHAHGIRVVLDAVFNHVGRGKNLIYDAVLAENVDPGKGPDDRVCQHRKQCDGHQNTTPFL